MRKSSRLLTVALGLLLLVSALLSSACPEAVRTGDDDRPIIIISSGSVIVGVKTNTWNARGNKDFDQDVTRGKSVKSFTVETVNKNDDPSSGPAQCTVSGPTFMVLYGQKLIVFTTKDDRVNNGRKATNVQFPSDATVTLDGSKKVLTVSTANPPATVFNETGDSCDASGMNIRVKQNHN